MTKEKMKELRELCEEIIKNELRRVDASIYYYAYSEAVRPQVIIELLAQIEALEARRVEISEEEIEEMAREYALGEVDTCHSVDFKAGFRAALAMVRGDGNNDKTFKN